MRTFPAFLATLLLLPSGLGAVLVAQENCATMAAVAAMSCCCKHPEQPSDSSGPFLSRSCCCDVKAPRVPSEDFPEPRLLSEGCPDPSPAANAAQPQRLIVEDPVARPQRQVLGPPRAPPRTLFLQYQRFLI